MRRFDSDMSNAITESMKVARLIKTNDPTIDDMPDLIRALTQNYKMEDWETIKYICERVSKVADGEIAKIHNHKKTLSAPIQEAFDVFHINPKMQWKSASQNAQQVSAMIMAVLPDGLGDFDASRVTGVIKKFGNLKYEFGREYSPVLYAQGFKDKAEVVAFANAIKRANPDEVDFTSHGDENVAPDLVVEDEAKIIRCRVWWD